MTLRLDARLAQRSLDVHLEVGTGERVAILGHNGSGKSTVLDILAGALQPDTGRAELDETVLFDLDAGHRQWLEPHQRGVALLAQEPLLFPHLTVLDNVAFGPRATGLMRVQARDKAAEWLEAVEALDIAGKRPRQLSGGQAQRVAIARALAAEPRLLLLDEPMAALDVAVAPVLRRVLARVLVDRSVLIVTHDVLDAVLLSDRIVVLESGRVVESGASAEVLAHPKTSFTARMAGLNLVRGVLVPAGVSVAGGAVIHGVDSGDGARVGESVAAAFAPASVAVHVHEPGGSPRNTIPVVIEDLEPLAGLVRVRGTDGHGHVLAADISVGSVAELGLSPGSCVMFSVKQAAVAIYAA